MLSVSLVQCVDKNDNRLVHTPPLYHSISQFRCEVANLTEGCDNVIMREKVPNTAINTDEGLTACSNSYLMTDPNWEDMEDFQPNVACAYYLPPVEGCSWVLELLKPLDPIVCGNNCECDCEDNVSFEEVDNQTGSPDKKTYCDFTPMDMMGGNSMAGWCGNSIGPDNVQGTLPFSASKNKKSNSNHVSQFSL